MGDAVEVELREQRGWLTTGLLVVVLFVVSTADWEGGRATQLLARYGAGALLLWRLFRDFFGRETARFGRDEVVLEQVLPGWRREQRFETGTVRALRYEGADAESNADLSMQIDRRVRSMVFARGIGRDDAERVMDAVWRVTGIGPIAW